MLSILSQSAMLMIVFFGKFHTVPRQGSPIPPGRGSPNLS